MAMEICPLADEIGNLADWVAVGVGAMAAVATTIVAVLAYRTANRATEIAGEAKGISEQQHKEAVAIRTGTAEILRSLLAVELAFLPAKLAAVLYTTKKAIITDAGLIVDRAELGWLLGELQTTLMPTSEEVRDQLHNFEGEMGKDVAGLIGFGRAISDLCRRFEARVNWESADPEVYLLKDGRDNFVIIRDHVRHMLKISLDVAPFFAAVAKSLPDSYDEISALANEEDEVHPVQ